jgi:hypothetical protein
LILLALKVRTALGSDSGALALAFPPYSLPISDLNSGQVIPPKELRFFSKVKICNHNKYSKIIQYNSPSSVLM